MRLDLVGEKTHDRVAEQLQFFVAHHPASGLLQKFVARELSRARSGSHPPVTGGVSVAEALDQIAVRVDAAVAQEWPPSPDIFAALEIDIGDQHIGLDRKSNRLNSSH